MTAWLIVTLLAITAGLVWKFALDLGKAVSRISWQEFAIGSAVLALFLVPLSVKVGNSLALQNSTTYNEYWNGQEVLASKDVTTCSRDGACHFEYDCDPYQVTETYWVTVTNADGKGSHTEMP